MPKVFDWRSATDEVFREAVRQWLVDHDRPQAWLAKKVGVKRQYLWQVMTGYDGRTFHVRLREKVVGVFVHES